MSHIHIEIDLKEATRGPVSDDAQGRTYARLMFALSPTWLQMPGARELMTTLGAQKDVGVARSVAATRARFTALAPDDALDLIGATFDLERLPSEADDDYRARLLTAFAQWALAGTKEGLAAAIAGLGYTAVIYPVRDVAEERWAEFGLIILDGERTVDLGDELRRQVLRVVQKLKAAHTRLAYLAVNPRQDHWDDSSEWDDGSVWYDDLTDTWDDGSVWNDGSEWRETQLYLGEDYA